MHDFKHIAGGEWWDEYECTKCHASLTTAPEDLMSVQELNVQCKLQCIEGKIDGKE